MRIYFTLLFCVLYYFANTQTDHYLYEAQKFSPPEKAQIAQFEGFPVTPIQASDIDGVKHNVQSQSGSYQLLWFWNYSSHLNTDLISEMNELHSDKTLSILCFADEQKAEMVRLQSELNIEFPVIPNSSMLGEAVYASELGYPRAFLVDPSGIIRRVFPSSLLSGSEQVKDIILGSIQ